MSVVLTRIAWRNVNKACLSADPLALATRRVLTYDAGSALHCVPESGQHRNNLRPYEPMNDERWKHCTVPPHHTKCVKPVPGGVSFLGGENVAREFRV